MADVVGIRKSATGIIGFDELTLGGLPTGRPTLVCGTAGCGKTLFASTFLLNGARDYDEPGVFVTFEERPIDIINNVASLGFDVQSMIDQERLYIEHISIDPSELEEIGDYDLEGLFLRLELAIDQVGAKRIVLDTIESLFSAFTNPAILRAEIRRLFDWLKDKGLTTIITGERGDGSLTRQGLEEYVSDCVILLDHRVQNQISTRRLRIVKYRGTSHGTNEVPFLIDEDGFSVLPVSTLGLNHQVSEDVFLQASGISTRCCLGVDFTEGQAFSSAASQGLEKARCPPPSLRKPAREAKKPSIFLSRSRSIKPSAICVRSELTCRSGSIAALCDTLPPGQLSIVWKCIWPSCCVK